MEKTFTSSYSSSFHQININMKYCLFGLVFSWKNSLLINRFIFIMKIPSSIYQFHPSFQIQYIFLFKLFLPFPIWIPIQHTRAYIKEKKWKNIKKYKNKKGSFKWSNVVYYNYPTGSTTPIYVEWKKKKIRKVKCFFAKYIYFIYKSYFSKMLIFVLFSVGKIKFF